MRNLMKASFVVWSGVMVASATMGPIVFVPVFVGWLILAVGVVGE